MASTAVLLASALLVTSCAAGAPANRSETGELTATLGSGAVSMNYTVPQLMSSTGLDRRNGVTVDYRPVGTSSTNLVAGVLSGDLTFANPAITTAIDAVDRGSPLVFVACTNYAANTLALRNDVIERIGVEPDAPARERVAALRGLTIATSAEGSGNNNILRTIIRSYGMNPDTDVRIIGVQDTSAIVGGVKQGQFDGAFYGAGVTEQNIAAGEASLWLSLPRGDVRDTIGDSLAGALVVRRDLLERDPDLVDAMFDATVAAQRLIADDPAAAGAELRTRWFPDLDQQVFDLAWQQARSSFPQDGRCTRTSIDQLLDQMRTTTGGAYSGVDYDELVYARAKG
ncbi:hypothetical protein AD006_28450 (plasmid) [Pseudonocardia sp. EC080610-09]|nr:hypothetical protein AD006_28450 [Pseudonocardia sp. EC080610-09]ALL85232.1 hypothetical protein AD017_28840 [Pseudonocardia sp. EC080619-01]